MHTAIPSVHIGVRSTLVLRVPSVRRLSAFNTGSWVAGSALARYPYKLTDALVTVNMQVTAYTHAMHVPVYLVLESIAQCDIDLHWLDYVRSCRSYVV